MVDDCFVSDIENVVRLSSLPCHEEELSTSRWEELALKVRDLLIRSRRNDIKRLPYRSLIRLLIVICGCLGNELSTKKLTKCSKDLVTLAQEILDHFVTSFGVPDVGGLLAMIVPGRSVKATVFDHILLESTQCIARLSTDSSVNSLSMAPLFRDALIWATSMVRFPVLCNGQQLSTLHPLSLQLIGDYRCQLKMLGLRVLLRLAQEVVVAFWRMTGRAEATLETLTCQRSTHSENAQIVELTCSSISALISLLEPAPKKRWYSKFMDNLLCDLALETLLDKKIVLQRYVLTLVDVLGQEVLIHSRRLLKAAELSLLAPRAPPYKGEVHSQEHESFLLQLNTLSKYVRLAADRLSPDIFSMVLPILIAFVDLEWNRKGIDLNALSMENIAHVIVEIVEELAAIDAVILRDTLNMCTELSPSTRSVLYKSTSASSCEL
ncbi:unnamed protein product [Hydatigera taeniaeformis]|uniref:DUF2428 domain-containing protein n=1 Tax=Hydatigena taeniaeformis TaxID=6205 RepID=A0A0R3X6H8_HYDTA|nr:unnamed protein product [Hydatigera taeniaeformis]